MTKNDIFTFTAPNGVEVEGIVVGKVGFEVYLRTATTNWLCYAQNRLFLCLEKRDIYTEKIVIEYCTEIVANYAILPDYDDLLERHNNLEVAHAETASGM